jgi:hypothetical protein
MHSISRLRLDEQRLRVSSRCNLKDPDYIQTTKESEMFRLHMSRRARTRFYARLDDVGRCETL